MGDASAVTSTARNFVSQQGFDAPEPASCSRLSSALLFQGRVVGAIALIGTIWQVPAVFSVLAALLWWSALLPRWNPFDFLYNHTLGARPGAPRLEPAPAPRRFAQGMAASFATGILFSMIAQQRTLTWVLQAFLLGAVAALVFGRLCLGSFVFHLVRGRTAFAVRTLPWGPGA